MEPDPGTEKLPGGRGDDPFAAAHDLSADVLVKQLRERSMRSHEAGAAGRTSVSAVAQDPNLAWLHRNWQLPPLAPPPAGRLRPSNARDWVAVRIVRIALHYLGPYLAQNQNIVAHMVRLHEAIALRSDAVNEREDRHYRELRGELNELSMHLKLVGTQGGGQSEPPPIRPRDPNPAAHGD